MLTAKEAKEKSNAIYNKKVDEEYLELLTCVETQIAKATEKGEFSLSISTKLIIKLDSVLKTVEALRDLGYSVRYFYDCNIRKIYINWGDA